MTVVPYFAALGAALLLIGFLFRSPSWIRIFAIAGCLCFIIYFAFMAEAPLWGGLLAALAIVTVNLVMLYSNTKDKRMFRLSAEEMMLFARLPGLTPGQFKLLLNEATWTEPKSRLELTVEGAMPTQLHYVLEGKVEVNRKGQVFALGPHAFVGELAYLRQKPATATVHAEAGGLIVSWTVEKLRALMDQNPEIKIVMTGLLSSDLAEKIARTDRPFLVDQNATR